MYIHVLERCCLKTQLVRYIKFLVAALVNIIEHRYCLEQSAIPGIVHYSRWRVLMKVLAINPLIVVDEFRP